MEFWQTIVHLTMGKAVMRSEWEPGVYCLLKDNILHIHVNGQFSHWVISKPDLIATDWVVIEDD